MTPAAGTAQLVTAALIGIGLIVVLIVWLKVHPFLALTLGSLTVGAVATMPLADTLESFTAGVGSTVAGVGVLIALGAMFGKLLADSGGADQIVDTIVGRASPRMLPWAMATIGAIIGLPMFFEIGLVLLMPVIYLVARRTGLSLITVGLPTLAGLSAMHGFVPPHPGPLAAIDVLSAEVGLTLGLGILVAIPTIVVAGPLFTRLAERWVGEVHAEGAQFEASRDTEGARRPSFAVTLATVLLPVVLMMAKAVADLLLDEDGLPYAFMDFVGEPLVALLVAVLVAIFTLGVGSGMDRDGISASIGASLPPIAGIILIVGAGGGFKQVLIDTGIAEVIADFVTDSGISVLLVAWLVAVLIRLATGSATVATITAAGIMVPLTEGMAQGDVSLLVLAIGAGSVFFSHVNDAGFWLIKEYFGMSVGQTIKSWSLMETVLSVSGLVVVLLLNVVV
ncbi:GntP family permease [Mumia sp. zg.B53]|uniref:GntT/GntP/DsdX family permease n=1 Tax=Mumia sp. TaxID=1965300 RepID=UPI001C6E923A|nr:MULTISPECIES: gluconate:H+ symporter [unclassified Mumia]MBW9205542.1 GntP family permease [Mumia sp. zg.B17]MBW9208457.1 GntP family permease [Mumia sp. zg.B21]MBW9216414.1 GntP family permease [Mumia sp. zg.B53]